MAAVLGIAQLRSNRARAAAAGSPSGRAGYRCPQLAALWPSGRAGSGVLLLLAAGAALATLQIF